MVEDGLDMRFSGVHFNSYVFEMVINKWMRMAQKEWWSKRTNVINYFMYSDNMFCTKIVTTESVINCLSQWYINCKGMKNITEACLSRAKQKYYNTLY